MCSDEGLIRGERELIGLVLPGYRKELLISRNYCANVSNLWADIKAP